MRLRVKCCSVNCSTAVQNVVDGSIAATIPDDADLDKETIIGADVSGVKLDSINAAIYIEQ